MIHFLLLLACQNEVIVEQKPDALNLYDAALVAYRKQDYQLAASEFERALNADKSSAELKNWLGLSLFKAGDSITAIDIYDKALAMHPGSGDLRYNRAAVLVSLERFKEAASDLTILYNNGHAYPEEVGSDPDFIPIQNDATFGYLAPKPAIKVKTLQSNLSGFVGERFFLEWEFIHQSPLRLDASEFSPLLTLERVVEQQLSLPNKTTKSKLFLNWTALSVGSSRSKTVKIVSGDLTANVDPMPINVQKIKERRVRDNGAELLLPSVLNPSERSSMALRLSNGWGLITAPPNARIELNTNQKIELEFHSDHELKWIGVVTTDAQAISGRVLIGSEELKKISIPPRHQEQVD